MEIADRLEIPPSAIAFMGDTGIDMQTAQAAGMFPIGALWGFRTADELHAAGARYLIAQPEELLPILSSSDSPPSG